jgi:probable F420-dependent oxidoreductase
LATVKFGVSLGRLNPAFFAPVAEAADALGFESVWLPEHLVLPKEMAGSPYAGADHPPVPPTVPIFDAAAYLSFLAGRTTQIRFGTYVYLLGIRHPFVSARAFATLDIVSGGRAEVGVGAGWLASEWDAVGLDFVTRGRRLDEAIGVCRRLWTEPEIEHHGEFFDFDTVCFEPKPVQQPPPILIGGESAAALGRAERLGDGWLGMGHTPESVAPIVERLRRPGFTITVSGDVRSADDVARFADVGVDRLIVAPWRRSPEAIEALQNFSSNILT